MKTLLNLLKIHFIGIGGVSMSGLAKYCLHRGFTVSGSDKLESEYTLDLVNLGAKIYIGHNELNLKGVDVVVYNSAIDKENVELKYAIENKITIFTRAEFLQWIISTFTRSIGICGCHGKTTATCMLTHILKNFNFDVCMHVGGRDLNYNNFIFGKDIFVTEVCEFKKNISYITTDVAVALNIDSDHLDSYSGIEELKSTYFEYLSRAKIAIINIDDKYLKEYHGERITFGIKGNADIKAVNLSEKYGYYTFSVSYYGRTFDEEFKVFGKHNVYNSLSAITTSIYYGVSIGKILNGLNTFKGVERRFESVGKINGVEVIADYCHHPVEIKESLNLAESIGGDFAVLFQPHTYSRTRILFDDFITALDSVKNLAVYKTYSARESYDERGSAKTLSEVLGCNYFDSVDEIYDYLNKLEKIDILYVFGAGDIYDIIKNYVNKKTP